MLSILSSPVFLLFLVISNINHVWGEQILRTSKFAPCLSGSNMTVQNLDINYNADNKTVAFNVAGTSTTVQNVTAQLSVVAYGVNVYQKSFDPCSPDTSVPQLCPVPAGVFAANGTQVIPNEYASQIPSIAFSVPDISATATLELKSLESQEKVACIDAEVTNGKTADSRVVSYVAAGMAGMALVLTGATAASAASGSAAAGGSSASGTGTASPSFVEVCGWFQGLAMNGMMSVNYPPVYRSFTKNFAFSTGIIPWTSMQISIDKFREKTGGNLTENSVTYLRSSKMSSMDAPAKISRRAYNAAILIRDTLSTSINATENDTALNSTSPPSKVEATVNGIKAYVEQLSVPEANTFLTVLLVFACVIAAIVVGILLCKVVLETWALFGSFPKSLAGFRKHYWATMARTIVQLILVLYGVWVLYCIYQFINGDSWAAKSLAAISLAIFTGVLAYFAFKIWQTASKLKELEGDASGLYQDKKNWLKYSMFYDSYSKDNWWMFLPVIVYMFAKGCVLAAGNGHGLGQTIAQLMIETLMLGLLIWNRPYERRSGNVINIFIQVVRALSVACILIFVEELGISQTTQTVTGVVLIAVQSVLTGALAILIATNAFIMWCKQNPHRKRRKEAGRKYNDLDQYVSTESKDTFSTDPSYRNSNPGYDNDQKIPVNNPTARRDKFFTQEPDYKNVEPFMRPIGSQKRFETTTAGRHRSESQDGLIDSKTKEPHKQLPGGYRGVAW